MSLGEQLQATAKNLNDEKLKDEMSKLNGIKRKILSTETRETLVNAAKSGMIRKQIIKCATPPLLKGEFEHRMCEKFANMYGHFDGVNIYYSLPNSAIIADWSYGPVGTELKQTDL